MSKSSTKIFVRPKRIVLGLTIGAILLVLASIAGQISKYFLRHNYVFGLVRLFNVDMELNFPTLFSTVILFIAAQLLLVIALLERKRLKSLYLNWIFLSCCFLLMAIDEELAFHEKLIEPMQKLFRGGPLGGLLFAWIIPGMILILIISLVSLRFILQLPRKTRITFILSAVVYVTGSIGMEIIGGRYAQVYGGNNFTYAMITTVEESLEMAGTILFIYGLLDYIKETYEEVRFYFKNLEVNQ